MDKYRVPQKGTIKLSDYDPNDSSEFKGGKKEVLQYGLIISALVWFKIAENLL